MSGEGLINAARAGELERVREVLESGVNVNHQDGVSYKVVGTCDNTHTHNQPSNRSRVHTYA